MSSQGQAWDLIPLVPSPKLDEIKKLIEQHIARAEQFSSDYKGKIATLSAEDLKLLFEKIQAVFEDLEGTYKFGLRIFGIRVTNMPCSDYDSSNFAS